jgi:hypothetical protein
MSPNTVLDVPGPNKAGEGDHWSSRSERTVVEGAPEAQLRYRLRTVTPDNLIPAAAK